MLTPDSQLQILVFLIMLNCEVCGKVYLYLGGINFVFRMIWQFHKYLLILCNNYIQHLVFSIFSTYRFFSQQFTRNWS